MKFCQQSESGAADVLIVAPPIDRPGGMAAVAAMMIDALRARSWRVRFFPTTTATRPKEHLLAKFRRHLRHFATFLQILRSDSPPAVWIHTCSGFSFYHSSVHLILAKLLRRRVILHMHGGAFMNFARASVLRRASIRRALELADAVVVLSDGWRRELTALAPRAQISVLENAVPSPWAATSRDQKSALTCRFGFLGRLDAEKGVHEMLEAARLLANDGVSVSLTLAGPAGTAGDPQSLAQEAKRLGIKHLVHLPGALNGEAKRGLFASCDAYVQPSYFEGMPLALLEAMACGLPVIATRVGAIPEIIEDHVHGLLIPPHDAPALAAAMRTLAADASARRKMGEQAGTLAQERFSVDRFANSVLRVLSRVKQERPCKSQLSALPRPLAQA